MNESNIDKVEKTLLTKIRNSFKEVRKVINNDYPDIVVCSSYTATDKSVSGIRRVVISFSIYEEKD